MNLEVLARLRSLYPSCTPVERDIADFVLANGERVVYMNITELASHCSVGESSIVRFCRRLGLSGYQTFRVALAAALEAERKQLPAEPQADPFERIADTLYQKYLYALSSTRSLLSKDKMLAVAEQMMKPGQLYLFGLGRSLPTVIGACQNLITQLGKGVFAITEYTQHLQAKCLRPEDTALFFSFHADKENLLDMAREARQRGAYTIAVTCKGDSPLQRLCNTSFCCSCSDTPASPSDLDRVTSKAAIAYVMETLCMVCKTMINGKWLERDLPVEPEPFAVSDIYFPTF